MSRRRCREVAELGSAYLDDALLDGQRDRLLRHVSQCSSCRTELDELRTVRGLLGQLADGTRTPPDDELYTRLVLIAGAEARVPLWARPFRRTTAGVLPSARRRARLRLTAALLSLGGLTAASSVGGYLAAPPPSPAVADPGQTALSEFAALQSELPLSSRPLDAMLTARPDRLEHTLSPFGAGPVVKAHPIARPAAVGALQRAANAARQVRFVGVQHVSACGRNGVVSAAVRIVSEPGQGSALAVLGRQGQEVLSRFVPPTPATQVDAAVWTLLLRNYTVAGWRGERLLGRPVTLVEATDSASAPSRPVARWWVDDATGLLLRQEAYDAKGALTTGASFTQISISAKPAFLEHLAPRLSISASLTPAVAGSAALASGGGGWPDEVAGLSLVQIRSDLTQPGNVHLTYSDGVRTLTVLQQRGTLAEPPARSSWDANLHAYVRGGPPVTATWRSSDTVLTVVSDGSASLVARAVAVLPHEHAVTPTTMGRVRAGWSRLADRVTG